MPIGRDAGRDAPGGDKPKDGVDAAKDPPKPSDAGEADAAGTDAALAADSGAHDVVYLKPLKHAHAEERGAVSNGSVDRYTFEGVTEQVVLVRVANESGPAFVPRITLLGTQGQPVDTASGEKVAVLYSVLPVAGTYTIVVSDVVEQANVIGRYKLHMLMAPGAREHGALVSGTSVNGYIDKADLDSFTFTANVKQGINLSVVDEDEGPLGVELMVFRPTPDSRYYLAQGTDWALLEFETPDTGTYTVVVADSSNDGAATGHYNLQFVQAPGATENGTLPQGTTKGWLERGDMDSYTITVDAGKRLELELTDTSHVSHFSPSLFVYKQTGAPHAGTCAQDSTTAHLRPTAKETFTVVVGNCSVERAAASYTLSLAEEE